jgi:hypothetical protein
MTKEFSMTNSEKVTDPVESYLSFELRCSLVIGASSLVIHSPVSPDALGSRVYGR